MKVPQKGVFCDILYKQRVQPFYIYSLVFFLTVCKVELEINYTPEVSVSTGSQVTRKKIPKGRNKYLKNIFIFMRPEKYIVNSM